MKPEEKYIRKVKSEYRKFLTHLFGNGEIKDRLLEGLENALKNNSMRLEKKLLSEKIDFSKMIWRGSNLATQIKRELSCHGIETYEQLINYLNDHSNYSGRDYLEIISNFNEFGPVKTNILYDHLREKGLV